VTDYKINEAIAEDWNNCFAGNGWLKELHPEAWKHPARIAFGLAERIYKEALQRGWLTHDSVVLDPFCGVAGCGFHAVTNGMTFVGVEIEQGYYEMARKNMDLWRDRYAGKIALFGKDFLIRGDSQYIDEALKPTGIERVDAIVSSPTYSELVLHNPHPTANKLFKEKSLFYGVDENYGKAEGQTGNMAPDVYWEAQEVIADKLIKILKPGGVAIWIIKRYVRDKKMVEFPMQWAEFYERKGLSTIAWIKAWQLDKNGRQLGMLGEDKSLDKDHRSFFRARHGRRYPRLAIDYEDVVVQTLPKKPFDEKKILSELGY